jgi:hypothetical protein
MAFARLVREFGGPDFPAEAGHDWRETLGLPPVLVAVWDFDYYQLSLRVESRSGEDRVVVLAKHRAASNASRTR